MVLLSKVRFCFLYNEKNITMYIYLYSVSNGFNNRAFDYNEAPVWLSLNMEAKNLGLEQCKTHNVSFWREKLLTKKNKN